MTIAALSTVVEWYDFTLYLYLATVLARVFYGGGESSLLITLGGFAISYAMRPLGAVVFGHIGDRYGRRRMLVNSMALMALAMLGTSLLPTAAQIGAASGLILFGLRCLMAFSVGGEYTGIVAYLLESAPERHRGLVTSLASAASEVGALLAAALAALTVSLVPAEALDRWGWRVPFLVGAVMAGSIWFARRTIDESPEFERQRAQGTVPASPVALTLRERPRALLRTFAISAMGSITYYVGITYVPAFLHSVGGRSEGSSLWLATLAAAAVIVVTPLAGALSDRIGRKPVLAGAAILGIVAPLALFSVMARGHALAIALAAVVLAFIAGIYSAVGAPATAEQFPGEGRLSGLALGVTVATAVFGGVTPFLAEWLIRRTGWASAPGAMIALVGAAVLPVLLTMPETMPDGTRRRTAIR